jgi:iron(III) transport system ATP-binding protein
MCAPVIVELEEVTKRFSSTAQPAVCGISFQLGKGDLLSLLGPSGCGKTTLLRLIAGFEQPQSGVIRVAGRVVAGSGQWVAPEQRDIGLVFQDFALFPHLTAADNIAFGLRSGHQKQDCSVKQRVGEVIELVGLQGFEHRYPHELSGGQQQRVALARALAPSPSLILLDEPLSNLDAQVRHYLREEVRNVLKETQTTGIFVTHDQEEALAIADWIAVMKQGTIEQLGRPEEVYWNPATRFVAEFVTQANFLPTWQEGPAWQTEIGPVELCPTDPLGKSVDLMIRQEDLALQADPTGTIVIRKRQFLGREYCYCLSTPSGQELHARSGIILPVGSKVKLSLPQQTHRVFPARPVSPINRSQPGREMGVS